MKNLHLYTDESGNTGLNLFDDTQPIFWTCTLVSEDDMNSINIDPILNKLGLQRIHANIIGLEGIEKITQELIDIIVDKKYFIFTRINKRFFAQLKLFDLIFDNGINNATTHMHYGMRGMRLPLAYNFALQVSPHSQEEFWEAYNKTNPDLFCKLLRRVKANILHKISDRRVSQLLVDAIDWSLENPMVFLEYKQNKLDSPNVAVLSLLLNNINKYVNGSGYEITEFVHDRQNQFGSSIRNTYDLLKNMLTDNLPTTFLSDVKLTDNFKCPINITSSDNSIGLQITDIALWLVKRSVEKGISGYTKTQELLNIILSQSVVTGLTLEQLRDEVLMVQQFIDSMPSLSENELLTATSQLNTLESARLAKLKK